MSFLMVIATLAVLRRDEMIQRRSSDASAGSGLLAGLRYVRTHPDVLRPLVVMAVMGTLAYNFQITIPTMVKYGYDLGAGPTASVMSLSAVGSVAGGLIIAGIRPHPRRTMAGSRACTRLHGSDPPRLVRAHGLVGRSNLASCPVHRRSDRRVGLCPSDLAPNRPYSRDLRPGSHLGRGERAADSG